MLSLQPTAPRVSTRLSDTPTALQIAHDDLDAAIAALLRGGSCDDMLITRLKKRKLQLKDTLAWPAMRATPVTRTG